MVVPVAKPELGKLCSTAASGSVSVLFNASPLIQRQQQCQLHILTTEEGRACLLLLFLSEQGVGHLKM